MSPAKILTEIVYKQVEFMLSHAMSNTKSHIIIQNTLIFMGFFFNLSNALSEDILARVILRHRPV